MVSKAVPQKEEDLLHLMNQPIYQVLMLMTPEESEKAAADFEDLKLTRSNLLLRMSSIKETLNWKALDELGKNMVLIFKPSHGPLVTQITT